MPLPILIAPPQAHHIRWFHSKNKNIIDLQLTYQLLSTFCALVAPREHTLEIVDQGGLCAFSQHVL